MISELNWQPLAERRRIARLVMFYRIHYQQSIYIWPYTLLPASSHHHALGAETSADANKKENALAYVIPSSSCDYHMYSFYPRTALEWNNLVQDVVQLNTPEAFRSALQSI